MERNQLRSQRKPEPAWLLWSAIVPALFALQGCSGLAKSMAPRMVPIQTARVTQMEFYRQWYTFRDAQHAKNVFSKLLGKDNWRVLEAHKTHADIVEDLLKQRIEAHGSILFTISLVPTAHDSFFVDGSGRYFMVRKTTNEIILSGDFYVKNKRYSIKNLDKGRLLMDIKQYVVRYFAPNEINYFQDVPISFSIQMDTKLADKSIYSIAYGPESRHVVLFDNEIIGFLEFDKSTPREDKLIDLRGRELILDDYLEIKKERP